MLEGSLGGCEPLSGQALEPAYHHFCHILLVRATQKARIREEKKYTLPLNERNGNILSKAYHYQDGEVRYLNRLPQLSYQLLP